MRRSSPERCVKGRLRAAFSRAGVVGVLLASTGCGSHGATPLGATLQGMVHDQEAVHAQAAEVPYASLSVRLGSLRGLMVMGAHAGANTWWPGAEGSSLALYGGGLYAASGMEQDLLATRYYPAAGRDADNPRPAPAHFPWRQDTPHEFHVVRDVRSAAGAMVRHEGTARLECEPATAHELPLGERELESCTQQVRWADGSRTRAELWRDPDTRHLWAFDGQPWPDAPRVAWQVARHWW